MKRVVNKLITDKRFLIFLFSLYLISAKTELLAQVKAGPVINLGEKYVQECWVNSNTVVQQGQEIEAENLLYLRWQYEVLTSTSTGYEFAVHLQALTDSLTALGETKVYGTEVTSDSNSIIGSYIRNLVSHRFTLRTDRDGKIISIVDSFPQAEGIVQLLALPESFKAGSVLPLFAFMQATVGMRNSAEAKVAVPGDAKQSFTRTAITDSSVEYSYEIEENSEAANCNASGSVVADAMTGIVQDHSEDRSCAGYMWLEGAYRAYSRKTSLYERFDKVN